MRKGKCIYFKLECMMFDILYGGSCEIICMNGGGEGDFWKYLYICKKVFFLFFWQEFICL